MLLNIYTVNHVFGNVFAFSAKHENTLRFSAGTRFRAHSTSLGDMCFLGISKDIKAFKHTFSVIGADTNTYNIGHYGTRTKMDMSRGMKPVRRCYLTQLYTIYY